MFNTTLTFKTIIYYFPFKFTEPRVTPSVLIFHYLITKSGLHIVCYQFCFYLHVNDILVTAAINIINVLPAEICIFLHNE